MTKDLTLSGPPKKLESKKNRPIRCTGIVKETGLQCDRDACVVAVKGIFMRGTRCDTHGGRTERARLRKQAREIYIEKKLLKLGRTKPTDPAEAILEQVWEANGNVETYRSLIRRLKVPESVSRIDLEAVGDQNADLIEVLLKDSPHMRSDVLFGPDHLGDLAPHVLITLYNKERERLVKFAKDAVECGIAERQQRLQEYQLQMMVKIITTIIESAALSLTDEQQRMARQIAAHQVRALSSGQDPDIEEAELVENGA